MDGKHGERRQRGQTSVEFMVVFAISILVLMFIFFIVYQQIIDTGIEKENAETQKTVVDLASAAREVYTQGDGASKTLRIILPSTYDAMASGIVNNSIVLKTRETYRVENLPFPVSGTLPYTPGAHDVVLTSRGSSVFVESALFKLSTYLVSSVLAPTSSASTTVTVENLANQTITVTGYASWPHADASLYVTKLNFTLAPYETDSTILTFTSTNATGGYSGSILFDASSPTLNDSQTLALYAEVAGNVLVNATTNLVVYPLNWSQYASPGSVVSQAIVVCANGPQSFYNVTFNVSEGAPGNWTSNLTTIPVVPPSGCEARVMLVSVPPGAAQGAYSGDVLVSSGAYSSDVNFSIFVSNPALNVNPLYWSDSIGPGGYSTQDFIICAQNLNINSVNFTAEGPAGGWILGLAPMGAIPSGFCAVKTMLISVPIYAAPGNYLANINASANNGEYMAFINVSVNVINQNMTVSPDFWNVSMKVGDNTSQVFMICSVNLNIINVSFVPSAGAPGNWTSNLAPKGPLNKGACFLKTLNLSIPNGTEPGFYSGNMTFSADGIVNVSVPLSVNAMPPYNNITVQSITHIPKPYFATGAGVNISAFANGSNNSGYTVTGCTLTLDGTYIYGMVATDGAFDQNSENITINLGQIGRGLHTAVISCTDSSGLPSRSYSYSFRSYKQLLFLYYEPPPTAAENSWTGWIGNQSKWSMDAYYAGNVTTGAIDEYNYQTIVIEEWGTTPPAVLKEKIRNYTASNKSVIFLGNALKQAPADFGGTGSSGGTDSEYKMKVLNSTHYISQGFTLGSIINATASAQQMGRFALQNGTSLGEIGTNPVGRSMLAVNNMFLFYGPTNTSLLSANGTLIATRLIDYALNQSVLTG